MNLVFEGLVRSTADGKSIEPCLATSWDISDDGLVYTFHLREDVKFSDGTPVTAEDWEYSLERSLELGAWNSLISSIDDEKAVDEKTIDIVLKNPSGSLLASLAAFFCAVVPKDYYSSTDDDTLASNPIGTGPFYLESWVPQESITEVLWGTKVSPGTISNLNKKVYGQIEDWRNRPLVAEYPYVYMDGIYLKKN